MWFKQSIAAKSPSASQPSTKAIGDDAEEQALRHLLAKGLMLVTRNFKSPGRGGGEIDLIMRTTDGTLVFVEVRHRKSASHGGAAASITPLKQRRLIFAAQHFLSRLPRLPPCRFDVVTVQGVGHAAQMEWLIAAFDAF